MPSKRTTTTSITNDTFHVHFGAGKLGLGLLLQAIESSKCVDYAIVQRPSSSWKPLLEAKVERVTVRVNGEAIGKPMRLLHGNSLSSAAEGQGPYFIAAQKGKPLLEVARRATSFSCSLHKGLAGIKMVLGRLPMRRNPPKLYACENDHAAVEELARDLKGRVVVIPCMVDRICSKRTILPSGIIDIKTEPWQGQIVVLPPLEDENAVPILGRPESSRLCPSTTESEESDGAPDTKTNYEAKHEYRRDEVDMVGTHKEIIPFGGAAVVTTETPEQAEYFARRKILLVNGTHTTLAFLTLIRQCADAAKPLKEMELPGQYDLLNYETADSDTRQKIWAWLVARCYIIAKEFETDVLLSSHNTNSEEKAFDALLNYAWTTLHRFSHVPDTTGRVLSGGVVKRFDGRLKNVLDLIREMRGTKTMTPETVLAAAGRGEGRPELTLRCMYRAVNELVNDALPIRSEMSKRDNEKETTPVSKNNRDKWNFLTTIRKALFGIRYAENASS